MAKNAFCIKMLGLTLPCLLACAPVAYAQTKDTITQLYTHVSLIAGVYDGEFTVGEFKKYGDLGLGTFNGFDGEMSILDGKVYQAKADGSVIEASDDTKIPYAVITPFEVDQEVTLPAGTAYAQLKTLVDAELPTLNSFYAIRIDGTFSNLVLRTIPAQTKPYPEFKELRKLMPTFEHSEIEGTLMGFRCPSYVKGLNTPGYHLHFISKDLQHSGHVANFSFKDDLVVKLDHSDHFSLLLPKADDFYAVDIQNVQGVYDVQY